MGRRAGERTRAAAAAFEGGRAGRPGCACHWVHGTRARAVHRHGGRLGEAHCGRRRAGRCALCTVHAHAYGGVPEVRRLRAGCERRRAEQRDREERHEQAEVSGMDIRIYQWQWTQDPAGGGEERQLRLRMSVDHYEPRCTAHGARRTSHAGLVG